MWTLSVCYPSAMLAARRIHPLLLLVTVLVTSGALGAGCVDDPVIRHHPEPTPPRVEPVGTCNLFTLDDGRRVCLMSEPQGRSVAADMAARSDGVSVEPLLDPSWVGPTPPRVDLREQFLNGCLQVRNQGECGWCVGHAAGAALDALYCEAGCPPARVSMAHLWSSGHGGAIDDCGSGWYVDQGLAAVTSTALVPEADWPYTNGSRGMNETRPSEADLARGGRYRATGYTSLGPGEHSPETIKRVLASGRVAVVSSGVCFGEGWSGGRDVIHAPTAPCGAGGAEYDGYHAYSIVGYDEATGEFIGLNSWGTDWGEGGYMRFGADFIESQILDVAYLTDIDRSAGGCELPDAGVPDGGLSDAGVSDGGAGDAGPSADPRVVAACEAITDCASCAATSGCLSCDGRCVAANATRDGAADGRSCASTATSTSDCEIPTTECSTLADCGACASAAGCSWCGSRGACVSWPSQSAFCSGSDRVATRSDQCNDVTGACAGATTCDACQALDGCGWCNSASRSIHASGSEPCVGGGAVFSDRTSCEDDYFGAAGECPMPEPTEAGVDADAGPPRPDAGSCEAAQGSCGSALECCDSLICVAGSCCGLPSTECSSSGDCCGGVECVEGRCACRPSGASCRQTLDCCGSDVCHGGVCQQP